MKKCGAGLKGATGEVAAVLKRPRQRDELGAIEVEHPPRLGLVAGGDVVAGHAGDVGDAVHRSAHQIGLECESVAVAARELHHGLGAGLKERDGHRER